MIRIALLALLLPLAFTGSGQDNQLTTKEKKEGWKLLFDGKTTSHWKSAKGNGFPTQGWRVSNGLLIVESSKNTPVRGGDIVTLEEFSDFELSVDFRLTEGANSGIKYFVTVNEGSALGLEFQILDDAKHPDAKNGKNGNRTIGSLYDLIPASSEKPSRPIGEWNTAKIISKGNHMEHWLNGKKVLEYERGSENFKALVADSKYKNIPNFGLHKSGRILLQDHSDEVAFKNIKIKVLSSTGAGFGKTLKETPGIVSYTFRHSFQKDVGATLDTIKSMGITNIEFSNLFGTTASDLRKMLDDRGMICTSYGTRYEELVNNTKNVGETARVLGASFVRVAWIPHDNKVPFSVETAKKAADDFNNAGKILKDQYGLTFCYHNHGYEFVPYENGTLFDFLAANTNPEYVSFELDILWVAHPGKDPVQIIKKYGDRIRLMHVKDLKKGVKGDFSGSTPVENDVTLGTGQIDVAAVIRAAQKSSIRYYYIEDESPKANEQVPMSLAFLKRL